MSAQCLRRKHFQDERLFGRPREQKLAFYENLCVDLRARCGIDPSDVMIAFTQNTDDDWSFGNGRAQFVTGEL